MFQKNLATLPSYSDNIFVHLKQKALLRPDLNPRFLSILDQNPARVRPELEPTRKALHDLQLRATLYQQKNTQCSNYEAVSVIKRQVQ